MGSNEPHAAEEMRKLRSISSPESVGGPGVRGARARTGAFGADKFGFEGLAAVHWNLTAPRLYEYAIAAGEAKLAFGGAPGAETGGHTGRSPKDYFIVHDN